MKEKFLRDKQRTPEAFAPHTDFILEARESYSDMRKRLQGEINDTEGDQAGNDEKKGKGESDEADCPADSGNGDDAGGSQGDGNDPDEGEGEQDSEDATTASSPKEEGLARSDTEDNAIQALHPDDQETGEEEHTADSKSAERNVKDDIDRVRKLRDKRGQTAKTGDGKHNEEDAEANQLQVDILKQLLDRMIQLEAEARQLLLDSMGEGIARTLLLADRNGEQTPGGSL